MAAPETSVLEDKIEYFRQLDQARGVRTSYATGPDSDDSLDEEEAAFRRACRRFHRKPDAPIATPDHTSLQVQPAPSQPASQSSQPLAQNPPGGPPKRVVSAPLPTTVKGTPTSEYRRRSKARNPDPSTSFVAETPIPVPDSVAGARRHLLKRSETTPLPLKRSLLAPAGAAMKRRRKGSEELKLVAEKDRVLAELKLYYIPNDDVAPARRARITKAREYGAAWTRDLGEATHVVVDKQLVYADILGVLGTLPAGSEAAVVNEDFPLDCIKFRRVLNPRQIRYQVSGYPGKARDITAPAPGKKGKEALPLKPPPANSKRWDYLPNVGTPSQSSGLSQQDAGNHGVPTKPSQEAIVVSDDSQPSQVPTGKLNQGQPGPQNGKPEPEPDAFGDELSGYMNMMQKYRTLPLDDEHDDD